MTQQVNLVQGGQWPSTAQEEAAGVLQTITLSSANSQSATVTGTGTALSSATASTALAGATAQLFGDIIVISGVTVANTYNTAQLANLGAATIMVFSASANTQSLLVYPPLGGTINGQAVNLPFGITAGKSTTFISPDAVTWFAAHAG